jgi:FkbM family methyltransferase
MASRFKKMVKAFGLIDAIKLYIKVKIKPSGVLNTSKYKGPFYLRPHTTDYFTFDQVFLRNQYDIHFPFEIKNIIDAGANIGLASVYFSQRFVNSSIVAIEPSKENFAILSKNIASYPNVKPLLKGLWNKDVHLTIIDSGAIENSFMVQETVPDHPNSISAISIATIMQEQEWEHIDLLKIDIEGAEKEVFESNYEYWLPLTKSIVIELHDQMKKGSSKSVFAAISKYNFSFSFSDENLVFINEDLV